MSTDHDDGKAGDGAASIPTLAEWAGGRPAFEGLTGRFYARVAEDPVLAPVFAAMAPEHHLRVAAFITEVFGCGTPYTAAGGSHAGMIAHHLGRHLTEAQRRRWLNLLLDTADEVGLADDPEFRAAFVGYLEWGSRLAVINSQPGTESLPADAPMPTWGWGPPGGPYRP